MGTDDIQNFRQLTDQDTSLRSLAYELKQPLIRIARQAELRDSGELGSIQRTAEQALRLVDTYLLSAQAEYGQLSLDLAPESTGSVLYDVSYLLHAETHGLSLIVDNRAHEPVMTHRPALISILNVFGATLLGLERSNSRAELTLRSYKTRAGAVGVGIFSDAALTAADLRQALELQGRAHMPMARLSNSSHVSLSLADGLCRAIGGTLEVKHMGRLNGLVTELPRSEQLALV